MSNIGGLTLLNTSEEFSNLSTDGQADFVNYPTTDSNGPYTILGPVLLPQIYGKDLNMLEIGSSGLIALSVNDQNVLKIDQEQSTMNGETFDTVKVEAQLSNEAIQFRSGTSTNKVVLDSFMVSENDTQNILSTEKTDGLMLDDVVAISQTLSVEDSVIFSSNLSVADDVVLSSNLSVQGVATFSSHAYVEGKVFKIPVGTAVERPAAGAGFDDAPTGSVYFNETEKKFQGLHDDGVWRNLGGVEDSDADTKILAELINDEDTLFFYADDANTPRMTMDSSNLSIALDVQIRDTLSVGDSVFFSSNLSVAGPVGLSNTLTVNDHTLMKSTLSVVGAVEMDNTLLVKQATILNSTLSVTGNVEMLANLFVNGEADITNKAILRSFLEVHDDTELKQDLNVLGNSMFTGTVGLKNTLSVEGTTDLKSAVQLGSTLSVTDTVTFSSNLSVTSDVVFSDTLSVANAVTFANTLSVGGATTLSNILSVTGATILSSTLSVGGLATFSNDLSVVGDVALNPGSVLTVDNIITTANEKDLVITLGSDSTGKLRINGDLEILGTLNQINTTIESVKVVDKTITLAAGDDDIAGSNQDVHVDSFADNHGAGLIVEGIPYGIAKTNQYFNGTFEKSPDFNTNDPILEPFNVYEKSFRWNLSDNPHQASISGMRYLGGLNSFEPSPETNLQQIAKESFWELKGGGLRITSLFKNSADLVDKVSYGFRISRNRQLQIVKHEWVSSLDASQNVVSTKSYRVLQTIGVSFAN
jgi:acyl-[acyl carrier protein]--UDP-N-acetylglucosamine O-acyltransferase